MFILLVWYLMYLLYIRVKSIWAFTSFIGIAIKGHILAGTATHVTQRNCDVSKMSIIVTSGQDLVLILLRLLHFLES